MMTITAIHLIPKAQSIFLTEHRTQYHWSPQSWTFLAKYVSHHLLMARTRKSKETFWMSLEVVLLYGKEIWCCASIFLRLKLKNYISSETDLRRDNICITFLNFYFFAKYLCKFHYKKNQLLTEGLMKLQLCFPVTSVQHPEKCKKQNKLVKTFLVCTCLVQTVGSTTIINSSVWKA